MREQVTTVRDLVMRLGDLDDGDRFEVGLSIYARTPWRPDSEAVALREEGVESFRHPGFRYLLEVAIARDVLEVWSSWREGRAPDAEEAAAAVIHYAENDAYQPVDDGSGERARLLP